LKRSQWSRVAISISVAKKAAPNTPADDGGQRSARKVRRKKYATAP